MNDELPPPAVILHVTRGEEMRHTYEQAVWGYGDHELFTADQLRAAIAAHMARIAPEAMSLADQYANASITAATRGRMSDDTAQDAARAALEQFLGASK